MTKKKTYVQPEIAVCDVLPCVPLATSPLNGTATEKVEDDDELEWKQVKEKVIRLDKLL